jgi:membrane protein
MRTKELATAAKATLKEFTRDDVPYSAAALTYYFFFSLFPLLILGITLAGMFLKPEDASEFIFRKVAHLVPGTVEPLQKVAEAAFKNRSNAGWLALAGVVLLAFTATAAFDALDKAINRAWGSERAPSFIAGRLAGFVMLLAMTGLFVASLGISAILTSIRSFTSLLLVGDVPLVQVLWQIISIAVSLGVAFGVFLLLYRFVPRCEVRVRDVWPAALVAAVAWTLVKEGFAYYLGTSIYNYEAVYGTLGAIVALLTWIYISSIILLTGAELSAEIARVRDLRQAVSGEERGERQSPWLIRET